MKHIVYTILCLGSVFACHGQFAPQAGLAGSTAIHKSSSQFVGWATGSTIQRGYMDIAQPSLGYATLGNNTAAVGEPDNMIVSLGDSGVATLTFVSPLYDGPGYDFAVFENGFPNPTNPAEAFLELAFVEVSSDGVNFYRFPAVSNTDTPQVPVAGVYMQAEKINNLAGKYISNYGTPFDLNELAGVQGLDINNITHVRLVDVIGDINMHISQDINGHFINDPYPTPIPGSGFDLDAVGAIHQLWTSGVKHASKERVGIYPNPAYDKITVCVEEQAIATLTDMQGRVLKQVNLNAAANEITLNEHPAGLYLLQVTDKNGNKWTERITKL